MDIKKNNRLNKNSKIQRVLLDESHLMMNIINNNRMKTKVI